MLTLPTKNTSTACPCLQSGCKSLTQSTASIKTAAKGSSMKWTWRKSKSKAYSQPLAPTRQKGNLYCDRIYLSRIYQHNAYKDPKIICLYRTHEGAISITISPMISSYLNYDIFLFNMFLKHSSTNLRLKYYQKPTSIDYSNNRKIKIIYYYWQLILE